MNQNPEQITRDRIYAQLPTSCWIVQPKKLFNLAAGLGVAVQEYQTNAGPADYVLFVDRKPVGIIEAKREDEGIQFKITMVRRVVPTMSVLSFSRISILHRQ
jgi:type I restriction enzyme R subunit